MTFRGSAPTSAQLQHVRCLFTDIDDTLTTSGRLLPQTYQALWDLHDCGIQVVPVTGGSAGWCEHIVRAWPVAAAIGESGAFMMTLDKGRVATEFWEDGALQARRQAEHRRAIEPLLGAFRLAHDQQFRLADVAIDIAGQPGPDIEALAGQIRSHGAAVAISSIHINTWIGTYDKRTMSERLLERLQISPDDIALSTAFVGDSRNDAPMFAFFSNTFGVANIIPVLDDIPTRPRWISERPAGLGFADIAQTLLAERRGAPLS
ncbi:HAD-IIB family hydrolase [Devosia faecipullorum]|uniref:HAD-IIB family hydrolase n=1 Tax=Devosia faecipullorum TaxID=2755039 RepID=UPI00187B4744|nr:HAD-IIB family hydrolase [Devosia faecipullorum]MBE7733750.1 HAD-IIB family hydrolase [Devosia faecipullorum]